MLREFLILLIGTILVVAGCAIGTILFFRSRGAKSWQPIAKLYSYASAIPFLILVSHFFFPEQIAAVVFFLGVPLCTLLCGFYWLRRVRPLLRKEAGPDAD